MACRSPGPCTRAAARRCRPPTRCSCGAPTRATRGLCGTAVPFSRRSKLSSRTQGPPWLPTRPTSGRCVHVATPSDGARHRLLPASPLPCGTAIGTDQWLRPAGASSQPDRVTYLRMAMTPPAGTLERVTAYVSASHTYRMYVNGAPVDAWPSFSYPDEQYARAVDLTQVLRPGKPNALGVLHRWYGPGQGRPTSSPGLLFHLSLWYAEGVHLAFGSSGSWRELPAEWLPSPQRNSDVRRLRGVGRRAGPAPGVVGAGLRRQRMVTGHRHRAGGYGAVQRDLRAEDIHSRDPGPTGASPHRRRWRRGGRLRSRLRSSPQSRVRARRGWQDGLDACGLPARSRRTGLEPAWDPGDQSLVVLHHARRTAELGGLYLLRLSLLPDRQSRGSARARPADRDRTARRHASGAGGDLLLGQPHAQRGVAAHGALVPLLQPGAVRRHADTRERAVHLGRRQRV